MGDTMADEFAKVMFWADPGHMSDGGYQELVGRTYRPLNAQAVIRHL